MSFRLVNKKFIKDIANIILSYNLPDPLHIKVKYFYLLRHFELQCMTYDRCTCNSRNLCIYCYI